MAQCDITSILEDGACFACLTDYQLELVQAQLLCDILAAGGGGGSGSVAAEGDNYCFTGFSGTQVLKLKNIDTSAANRIDAVGADPIQTIEVQPESAC